LRPQRQQPRKLARIVVVAPERAARGESSRTEEDHRVADALAPEALQRREILGEDPDRARVGAVQKGLIPIGNGRAPRWGVGIHARSFVMALARRTHALSLARTKSM